MIKTLRAKLVADTKKQRQYQTPHMHWLFPFYFNQSIRPFPHCERLIQAACVSGDGENWQGETLMAKPIMARATAVWLVDNTTMTFKQIADFVGMHEWKFRELQTVTWQLG